MADSVGIPLSKRISEIKKQWFLSEPLLFAIASRHTFVENPGLSLPLRTGRLMVEYNPELLKDAADLQLEAR